jgi:hypothetical protein
VAFKFVDDLPLTRKVPFTFANVAFDVSEVIEKDRPLHTT